MRRRGRTRSGDDLGRAARGGAAAAALGFGPSEGGAGQPTSGSGHRCWGGRGCDDRLAGGGGLGRTGRLGCAGTSGGAKGANVAVARIEAVAGWAEMLRDTMAAAAGLEQAIVASAPLAPLPIRAEVATLALRLEGERLAPALRAFADDVADPTCDLVVAALVLAAEHQAQRLGELLGSLAQAARDQATMRLRVEAGRARTRTSVRVIVGATGGLVLGLAILNRGYLAPYDTPVGQLVLLLVGAVFTTAFVWLARMTRPSTTERFLTNDSAPANRGSPLEARS